jgi:hypothetical protein
MIDAFAAILLAFAGSVAASAPPGTPADSPAPMVAAEADFAHLASLAGDWRNAENPQSALRVRFALTAGGTVLQESWLVGDRLHSLTLYHRDGGQLVLTHYCPQGNQPTLVRTGDGTLLGFTFRSATDLDPAQESHLHDLSFDLSNPARPVRREVYRSTAGDEASTLVLERVPVQYPAP